MNKYQDEKKLNHKLKSHNTITDFDLPLMGEQ